MSLAVDPVPDLFGAWTADRTLGSLGTNAGAVPIAFQKWHHFKEAFPPELIRRAVAQSADPVIGILDPFGGSGTTALAAQFLGIPSTTVEINPFLADVIRAKLAAYEIDDLLDAFGRICRRARRLSLDPVSAFPDVPGTFLQSPESDRWLFDTPVAKRLAELLAAIDSEQDDEVRRFFRVQIGGMLTEVSNVLVSGKGRRYRRNWQQRIVTNADVDRFFSERCRNAMTEAHRFGQRPRPRATVINGDSRRVKPRGRHSLAIFSPPYPNSFDYTDVYNVELWMLGYLRGSSDNSALRRTTLASHVQILRDFADPPEGSRRLNRTMQALNQARADLWSPWIPDMVGAYFADLCAVLERVHTNLGPDSECWIVIGDSQYANVRVPAGQIVADLARCRGWQINSQAPCRSMKGSAQQGRTSLAERLLILRTPADH